MKDIIWLIKNSLSVTFKNKKNILLYLCTPLIGIVISFLSYGNMEQPNIHVGIINHDQSNMTEDTINFIKGLDHVKISKLNENELDKEIVEGTLDCAIIFDNGFTKSIQAGNPTGIRMVSIKGAQITGFVKSYLYQYIDNVTAISQVAGGNQSMFDKMYTSYLQSNFKLTTHTLKDTTKGKMMTYQSVGFLMMIMLFSAGNLSEIILKEKENRTYFRLLSTPINARKYLFSNVVVNLIVMTVQVVLTVLFMKNVFHINTDTSFGQMMIILLLFGLVSVGLSLMIISFSNSTKSAGAIQNLVTTPTCLLAGCFWPVEIMPKTVQKIANFLPQRWILNTIGELQKGHQLSSLYLNVMIIIAFAVAFFLVAVYKFGRNNNVKNFV